jgi:signal transduction histidine kinase
MRFVFFIGLPLYRIFRFLSWSLFAQFLSLIGLNLINAAHADVDTGPAFRFANKLESVPPQEFYDIIKVGDVLWFAGQGLSKLEDGVWTEFFTDGRYTALAHDRESGRLWFAGPKGIGHLAEDGEQTLLEPIDAGYIWFLFKQAGRMWYVGSTSVGWVDPETGKFGFSEDISLNPRPFLANPENAVSDRLFTGSEDGLWEMLPAGLELVLPLSVTNDNIVTWICPAADSFLLGTSKALYRWSGEAGDLPVPVTSNYSDFFKVGINNAMDLGNLVALADFPEGVLFLDKGSGMATGYSGTQSGAGIGDIYKIEEGLEGQLLMVGTQGVASVNLDSQNRFFPAEETWDGAAIEIAEAFDTSAFVVTPDKWIQISGNVFKSDMLPTSPYWIDEDPAGRISKGFLNSYNIFTGDGWELSTLPEPVNKLMWGSEVAYATGQNGLYTVTENLEMRLIYESTRPLNLLGELGGHFFLLEDANRLLTFERIGEEWIHESEDLPLDGRVIDTAVGVDAIYLSTGEHLYRLDRDRRMTELPLEDSWEIAGLTAVGDELAVAYRHPLTGEQAAGVYAGEARYMLAVPYLEEVGDIQSLIGNGDRLGILGENGLGWYARAEMPRVAIPEVSFDLLFEDKRIQDRTIPSGMHFIDLQVYFDGPEIPSIVQYRINEQRWRNVNLRDPTLQFAGHGSFSVELRAVHPNGVASRARMIQFGISPPWYLNPLYQGIVLALLVALVWGVYILRHAQLKRTNLWLQSEVKKQTRELEAATAARTNFLAGLSHDIRNPLNGVLMIAETLTRDPPTSGDDSRLKDLTEFGVIVDRMLGEILDFSAIDQSNMPMAFIPVSISDILNSSVKQNQFSIQKALVNMSVVLAPELKEVVIKTDRNWMIKILTNLIVNSLEYSESERIEVGTVCHRLTPNDVEMEIYVKDWGKGIDDAEKGFVFDRFYRGESGIESGKHGTGLGLSICQEIAHSMGTHLTLTDNEPSGCCFSLKGRFERVSGAKELDREAVLQGLERQEGACGRRLVV